MKNKLIAPTSGADIKNLRRRIGMTIAEMALEVGVHSATIIRWEKQKRVRKRIITLVTRAYMKQMERLNTMGGL